MNKKFAKRLNEYLDSECDDYDLEYSWEWVEDCNWCEVTISKGEVSIVVNFRYNDDLDCLYVELSEDSFYKTAEFEPSVKYFWMLISPVIFKS